MAQAKFPRGFDLWPASLQTKWLTEHRPELLKALLPRNEQTGSIRRLKKEK